MKRNLKFIFKQLINFQDNLNVIINPNWKNEITDKQYSIAFLSELNELLECYNWEWWKKKEVNLNNAKVEVIDIFHFLLSINILKAHYINNLLLINTIDEFIYGIEKYYMENHENNIIDKILYLNYLVSNFYHNSFIDYIHRFNIKKELIDKYDLKTLYSFFKYPLELLKIINVNFFVLMQYIFNENTDEFFKMYILKYILNIIRQKYGYKIGDYKKVINNQEDNEILHLIMKEINVLDIEDLIKEDKLNDIFKLIEQKLQLLNLAT